MGVFQSYKNTCSYTLDFDYLRWKYIPQEIHQVSNNVMKKNSTSKRKRRFYFACFHIVTHSYAEKRFSTN